MATPSYLGVGQPAAKSGGLFGRLGSYFGNETPAYAGAGQPARHARRLLAIPTPAYAAAPMREPLEAEAMMPEAEEEAPVMCPIDPQALAEGQIAIVIPRQGT